MDVVIENFYNTINVTCDNETLKDLFSVDDVSSYDKLELLRKAREHGLSIKELSIISNLTEEDIIDLLEE